MQYYFPNKGCLALGFEIIFFFFGDYLPMVNRHVVVTGQGPISSK
jgi:hypothetical protein